MKALCLLALAVGAWHSPAFAAETVTYTYDAQGRLIKVIHTGAVNNGVQTTYNHDKADNRTNATITGAPQ